MQGAYVWVIDGIDAKGNGTARIQPVKVALAEGQLTILDSGIRAGQGVVVDGADRLRPGQAVTATMAPRRADQAGGPFTAMQPAAQAGAGKPNHEEQDKRVRQ
jgi:hypothetical protein